jgi:hypothetical protein
MVGRRYFVVAKSLENRVDTEYLIFRFRSFSGDNYVRQIVVQVVLFPGTVTDSAEKGVDQDMKSHSEEEDRYVPKR